MSEKLEYKFPSPYFPDWDEVSNEDKYRAFDADGKLFYYNNMPVLHEQLSKWKCGPGIYILKGWASRNWAQKIWRDSLEKRPDHV